MVQGVNIRDEVARKTFLAGRTFETTPEQEAQTFARLADFGEGAIFAGGFSGESCWERHPQGDEIVQVIDGAVEVTILDDAGTRREERIRLGAGMLAVVPRSKWHRLSAANGVTLITVTPLPTECSTSDPRDAGSRP